MQQSALDDETMTPLFYCRDDKHIYSSISEVTGVLQTEVDGFIQQITCGGPAFQGSSEPEHVMLSEFTEHCRCAVRPFETCYFHGTRCLRGTTYARGLLPVSDVIDEVWDSLFEFVHEDETRESWNSFRKEYEASRDAHQEGRYWWRVLNDYGSVAGPWGKLIREEWFIPGRGDNHYVDEAPEIITIICMAYRGKTGIDLSARYLRESTGCIIHFRTAKCDKNMLGYALLWLLHRRNCPELLENGFYGLASMCGEGITPDQILEIERLA